MKRESLWRLRMNLHRCLCLYIAVSLAYIGVSLYWSWMETIDNVDRRLEISALALPAMLAPDFHDRATGPESISMEEELRNRKVMGDYGEKAGFAWVYTLIERDGSFFFAAPSVSEKEAAERRRWYYLPYNEIPMEFVRALETGSPVWVTYTDRWGTFRSVAYPFVSDGGRTFLSCVDYDIGFVKASLVKRGIISAFVSALFLLVAVPFFVAYRKHGRVMEELVIELENYNSDLESMVLERTRRLDGALAEMSEMAIRDPLTGLFNRSYGVDVLNGMSQAADGASGWLILVDLDDFKRINDDLGHQTGDEVLRQVGECLVEVVDEGDIPVRYGGDDFIVITSDAEEERIRVKAEGLRERISRLGDGKGWSLSVSTGISRIVPGVPVKFVIDEADRDLYSRKKR